MPVHINEITTEVIAEPQAQNDGAQTSAAAFGAEPEVIRSAYAAMQRLAWRTAAEGFDD